jgi:hypothetical protein
MIAQGWGGAAGKAGNAEWQAVIAEAKNCWNAHANASKNVTTDEKIDAHIAANINVNMGILKMEM